MKIGILEALGGSWGHLGPKMGSRAKKTSKNELLGPLLGAKLRSKIDQNRSQERSKMWSFLGSIWEPIFWTIWCQLDCILVPQTLPKWGKVGSKIDPSWGVDLTPVFWRLLGWFLYIFVANITWRRARFHRPCRVEINFFVFWLLCCWLDFLIDFWLIFGRFWARKSIKNRSKINP